MATIFLVCTVHEESGSASVNQLHAILGAIHPEVVFLEVPSETVESKIAVDMNNNLESKALSLFQADHNIKLVPVDLPTPSREFFENYARVHKEVEEKSIKYRQLVDSYSSRVRKHGFYYLNSEYYSEDLLGINKEIEEKLESIGNDTLKDFYSTWLYQISLRDIAMYRNIKKYCADHSFKKGIFLVGAAHRMGIIKESQDSEFEWNYDGKGYWYPQNNT